MRIIILLLLILGLEKSGMAQRTQFTQLPAEAAPELYFEAPKQGQVSLKLKFLTENYPCYLKLVTRINRDTLEDYLTVRDSVTRVVKQFHLNGRDMLTFQLFSNNQSSKDMVGIFGVMSCTFDESRDSNKTDDTYMELPGALWDYHQPIEITIDKQKESKEYLDLRLGVNNNYPYDSLFLKIEAIGPGSAPLNYELAYEIQSGERNEIGKIIHLDIKKLKTIPAGLYKIKITHQLADQYLNGIDFVSWQWIDK